jgi:hypothetical protein
MPTTQAEFRARLEALVGKFKANASEYLSTEYSEAQARHQFIDPRCDFEMPVPSPCEPGIAPCAIAPN